MPRYKKDDVIDNRFKVHQVLMGGMGEVYLGYDYKFNSPYALKTFQAHLSSPQERKMFEGEVYKWVQLERHPNIVRCYLVQTLAYQPFMFLEWVVGKQEWGTDLYSWLRRGPLSLQQALDFTIDVCRGLIHAQEKQPGMVHRDLKPGNILIEQAGSGEYIAKITDFGLATVAQETGMDISGTSEGADSAHARQTRRLGGVVGTPPYMPPEQWRNEPLDVRTDIYAIGCILHEMLTGNLAFQVNFIPRTRPEIRQWLSAWQTHHSQSPLPTLPESVPEAVTTLMQRCLAKERENRFASLNELLTSLSALYQQLFTRTPKPLAGSTTFSAIDHNNRGTTLSALGRYEEALADYGRAIALNPEDAGAHNNRGITYQALGRYEEALADYGRAIALNPSAEAHYNRGTTLDALGRYEEALADYGRAIALNPEYAEAHNNRGTTLSALGRYEEALADYGRAIALNPSAEAHFNIGVLYYNRGQKHEALPYFQKAAQLGNSQAPQIVERIRRELGMPAQENQFQQAFNAFAGAKTLEQMIGAVRQYNFMTGEEFMTLVTNVIQQQVPQKQQAHYKERLRWLQMIAVRDV